MRKIVIKESEIRQLVMEALNEISNFHRGAAAGARKAQWENNPSNNKSYDKYRDTLNKSSDLRNRDKWNSITSGNFNSADDMDKEYNRGMKYGYNKYRK